MEHNEAIYSMIADGMLPPSEVELALLEEIGGMVLTSMQHVTRLNIEVIKRNEFMPNCCFSNAARVLNGIPRYGWMVNDAEEAFVLHAVVDMAGRLICVTPPYDYYDELHCAFILDTKLEPAYDGPDGSFNGCTRDGVRVPRILRKNYESSRFFFERLKFYIDAGHPRNRATDFASEDANARDGKPMQVWNGSKAAR